MKKVIKIPKKIQILGTEYQIIPSTSSELKKTLPVDGILLGLCNFEDKTIQFDSSLKGPTLKRILRHETIHAFFDESGLDSQFDPACDEALIDWIALQFPKMSEAFKKMGIENDD